VGFDWRLGGFVLAAGIGAVMLAGLAGLGAGAHRPSCALADAGRAASEGPVRRRVRHALVAAQFAASLALVVAAVMLTRTVANIIAIPTGLALDHVVLIGVDPQASGYDASRARQYVAEAERRLLFVPGVQHAAYGAVIPLGGWGSRSSVFVPGYAPSPDEEMEINYNVVTPGYFDALGIPLVDGRGLQASDVPSGPVPAIVNETMARRYWPNSRAIGRRFHLGSETGPAFDVVGVARDVKYRAVREESQPSFYYPLSRSSRLRAGGVIHVRTDGSARALVETIRRAAADVDPAVPVMFALTLNDQRDSNLSDERLAMLIAVVLGGAALLLAAVGLFAAMSQVVGRRTREIGVRMALGATPAAVAREVIGQSMSVVAIGAVAGFGLSIGAASLIASRLYGLAPNDAVSFVVAAIVLLGVALIAAWAPARRAARVDPIDALRE
jgi:predicted permease